MKPLLRWAGSKKQIIRFLYKYWDSSFIRYVEPFAGSASLYFLILPNIGLLNDLNKDLIDTYIQVKENPHMVVDELSKMQNTKSEYYRIRSFVDNLTPEKKAARFIYLNTYCFNGLYRTNRDGQFNVPYGGLKSERKITSSEIEEISRQFSTVKFYNLDFEEFLSRTQVGDFVYIDPPYRVNGKRTFIEYGPVVFTNSDLERLAKSMKELDSRKISFVVSYIDSEEGRNLADNFHLNKISVKRNISGFSSTPIWVDELLISNMEITIKN